MNRRQAHRAQRRNGPNGQAGPLKSIEEIQPGEERGEEFHPSPAALQCRGVAGHIRQKGKIQLMTVMKIKIIPCLGFQRTHNVRLNSPLHQRSQCRIGRQHTELLAL